MISQVLELLPDPTISGMFNKLRDCLSPNERKFKIDNHWKITTLIPWGLCIPYHLNSIEILYYFHIFQRTLWRGVSINFGWRCKESKCYNGVSPRPKVRWAQHFLKFLSLFFIGTLIISRRIMTGIVHEFILIAFRHRSSGGPSPPFMRGPLFFNKCPLLIIWLSSPFWLHKPFLRR